jgi:DNA replication protein DnaC
MIVRRDDPTIGQFLQEVAAKSGLKAKTFRTYSGYFRRIVADIFGMGKTSDKFSYRNGKRTAWVEQVDQVRLLEARDNRTLQRLHKQLERLDLLLLDELGYVPFSKAGAELLFEVVSRAYERTSLLVTTNLPFAQWTEVLGSERLTGALLDRLTHRVHILEANGQSYRLQDAKGRLKRK